MTHNEMKEIGQRIRTQREFLKLTRENMAKLLDVSVQFLAEIEYGNKGMSLETLKNSSIHLKISTDYIIFGKK